MREERSTQPRWYEIVIICFVVCTSFPIYLLDFWRYTCTLTELLLFNCTQVNYLLRTGVPIEKHAASIYTRSLFERFFRELFRSGAFVCRNDGDAVTFTVEYACSSSQSARGRLEYIIHLDRDRTNCSCVCKYFEHSGIPCRHMLKVVFCYYISYLSDNISRSKAKKKTLAIRLASRRARKMIRA